MTFLSKRKKKKIAKALAATWYDLTFGLDDPSDTDIETIGVIIANLAGIAVEVGGMKMSKTVADLYEDIHKNLGWDGK